MTPITYSEIWGRGYYWDESAQADRWEDTGELVRDAPPHCPKCGLARTPEGHDPCMSQIPGAVSACCGHGLEPPYVSFLGDAALRAIEWARNGGTEPGVAWEVGE